MNMIQVNLTTTHNRLHLCAQTVWSLFNQSLPPGKIVVWVSSDGYLSDEGIEVAPAWAPGLNGIKNILEFKWTRNTGPYRKLFPALMEASEDQVIVYADDDVIYAESWLRLLYDKFQQHQGTRVVASRVRLARRNFFKKHTSYMLWPIIAEERELRDDYVITGVGGAILKKRHVLGEFVDNDDFLSVCPRADDFWISEILRQAGTPVIAYPLALKEVFLIEHGLGLINHNGLVATNIFRRVLNKISSIAVGYWGFNLCNNDTAYRRVVSYFRSWADRV